MSQKSNEKLTQTITVMNQRMEQLSDQLRAKDIRIQELEQELERLSNLPDQRSVKSRSSKPMDALDDISPGELIMMAYEAGFIKI
jgi:predicted RNase H-like nuclease (RuvC/YqgF family)